MQLCTTSSERRRMTPTISHVPFPTSVCLRPASSISTVANTYTTSASPEAVSAVVTLGAARLHTIYEIGIATISSADRYQAVHDAHARGTSSRHDRRGDPHYQAS